MDKMDKMDKMNNIDKMLISDNFSLRIFAITVNNLRRSEGFFSRLYRDVNEMYDEDLNELIKNIAEQDFKDTLDVIMWLEA